MFGALLQSYSMLMIMRGVKTNNGQYHPLKFEPELSPLVGSKLYVVIDIPQKTACKNIYYFGR